MTVNKSKSGIIFFAKRLAKKGPYMRTVNKEEENKITKSTK
jgi:hypothetical protein